jgi:ABC-type sugar transport system ATPase subunit
MASVTLQHVDKVFPNGVLALRDVNLELADGELFVLVGPSGSGKTTTLRLVAGLEEPTRGQIAIGGRSVNSVRPADRGVAMVFQDAALYPHMTVRENIGFGLKMRGRPRAEVERLVDEVADALSIGPFLNRRPSELSGGEQSRVAIARAVVRAPQVLLFDEPLSDLDPPLRAQLRLEIAGLRKRFATTILYVTHDQSEAMMLGDRIGVMNAGAIEQVDTPMGVYQRPANAFVASFLGSPGMNLFRGEFCGGRFHFAQPSENGPPIKTIVDAGNIAEGPAVLGVRPSDFVIARNEAPLWTVNVEVIERLGHETLVHFELAGSRGVACLPADVELSPLDSLPLAIRPGSAHLFSAVDGRRLN